MALGLIAAAQYFVPGSYPQMLPLHITFVVIWVIILNAMAYRGIDAGVTMLVAFGIITSLTVVAMTLPSFIDIPSLFQGMFQVPFDTQLLQPFYRYEGSSIISYLGLSLLLIIEAFFGFEAVSYMANEAKEPKKLHRVLITAMILCGVITSLYVFSSLGIVPYQEYITSITPFAVQAFNTLGATGKQIVVFGMYLAIVGSVAAWPITGSRLIRAMAGDKLFLRHFAVLHRNHKSPHRAVLFQSLAILLFTGIIFRGYLIGWQDPYRTGYLIYVLITLVVLSLILLAVPILRRKEAHLERPFKAPLGTVGPILAVLLFAILIANWIWIERGLAYSIISISASFIALGLPFYFFVAMLYDSKAIVKVNEYLSYVAVLGEKVFFPLSIRGKLLKDLGNIRGKVILEYGCSFGNLTRKLAPLVGPRGRIFATDLALHKVRITDRRTKFFKHVSVHHHPSLEDFTLKPSRKIDGVISVGMLSYMQKPEVILKRLSKHINKGGEIVFLDYDKFFYIIPNVSWIESNQKLINLFARAGFNISVERKKGLLWTYVIISGKKK